MIMGRFQSKHTRNGVATGRVRNGAMDTTQFEAGAILPPGASDEPLEAWAPEEFDHFTDLGLLRSIATLGRSHECRTKLPWCRRENLICRRRDHGIGLTVAPPPDRHAQQPQRDAR